MFETLNRYVALLADISPWLVGGLVVFTVAVSAYRLLKTNTYRTLSRLEGRLSEQESFERLARHVQRMDPASRAEFLKTMSRLARDIRGSDGDFRDAPDSVRRLPSKLDHLLEDITNTTPPPSM